MCLPEAAAWELVARDVHLFRWLGQGVEGGLVITEISPLVPRSAMSQCRVLNMRADDDGVAFVGDF